jgi:glycosyltransferase involved in cell wall biosynthesis
LKILHLTPSYKPATTYGGPIFSVSKLCEALQTAGHEVQVLSTLANGKTELQIPAGEVQIVEGVKVRYYPRWTKDHSHFSPALLWAWWRAIQPGTVLHVHSWWNLVAILGVALALLKGQRPVLSPRGMLSAYTLQSGAKRLFHHLLGRHLLRRCVLHATSEQEAKELRTVVPGARYFVAPNLLELPQPQARAGGPVRQLGAALQLLFLSRIHPKKGLELLFSALARADYAWQLTVAGTGEVDYIAELKDLALGLNIAENIRWAGWVEGVAKWDLLERADLLVLPSQNENFANVVLEALALGTPVLLSTEVGLSEYVQAEGLGWGCAAEVNALRSALAGVASDRAALAAIRVRASEQVRQDFSVERVLGMYLAGYGLVGG